MHFDPAMVSLYGFAILSKILSANYDISKLKFLYENNQKKSESDDRNMVFFSV